MTKEQKAEWASKLWITWYKMGFGVWQFTAFHPDYVTPVGVVWVTATGGKMPMTSVHHSYTMPYFRRRGVRTAINAEIKKHCKVLHTWEGTKQGGEAFLKASGYTFDRKRGDWYLLVEAKKKRSVKRKK